MKIVTGNRLNEFWDELKGVFVPKSKVLKTMEEIEANTNEENVAGATALKEVNNKLMHGNLSFDYTGGKLYAEIKDGADTVRKKLGDILPDSMTIQLTSSTAASVHVDYAWSNLVLPNPGYKYMRRSDTGAVTDISNKSSITISHNSPFNGGSSTVTITLYEVI